MKIYIFRNSTVEPFFSKHEAYYSGYDDITIPDYEVDCYLWFYMIPVRTDILILRNEINSFYKNIELIAKIVPSTKTFYIFSLAPIYTNIVESGDFSLYDSLNEFNSSITRLPKTFSSVKIINFQSFTSQFNSVQLINWKYYYLSRMLLDPGLADNFEKWFALQVTAIKMQRKKCIILDLDNTIWGGILGEDGISGIKIGGDYPGNAFLDFQKSLLELHKSGIILAICSKNNESDVFEAWEKIPDLIIKNEYLATYRINWKNKDQNISEIINQLNIGADSVVFIDDNPSERDLVKKSLPMVETPDFPAQPYMLPSFIKDITDKYFKIYQITNEDKVKTQQYRENSIREEFQKGFSDFEEYLTSLEINIEIKSANDLTIARISQMTQKTNQFNLTTKRYTESEIRVFLEKNDLVYYISVSDRFGDNGISGLGIFTLDAENKIAEIDTLLLSCRILGKGIEEVFLNYMLEKLKILGFKKVTATYIQTAKNTQVKDFYDRMDFILSNSYFRDVEYRTYYINLMDKTFAVKPFYSIIDNGN